MTPGVGFPLGPLRAPGSLQAPDARRNREDEQGEGNPRTSSEMRAVVGPGLRHGAGCSRAAVAWPHFLLCTNSLLETVHRCGQCVFLKSWCVSEAKFLKNLGTQSHASCEPGIGLVAPPCPSPALPGSFWVALMVLGDPKKPPVPAGAEAAARPHREAQGKGVKDPPVGWLSVLPFILLSVLLSFLLRLPPRLARAEQERNKLSPRVLFGGMLSRRSGFLFGSVVLC